MKSLLPDVSRNPYYVYAPPYVQTSAGVRVLHLLCHWLNRSGERAYIAPILYSANPVNPDLQTPLLRPEIVERHAKQGCTPIVIYPETESGNQLDADCVVRYVLNTPGHLAGDRTYPPEEMVWAYSRHLASQCERCDGVLHMPVVDQNLFKPDPAAERSGSVFYAAKYRQVHGQEVFDMPEGAIEITRDLPDSQTTEEVAQLLKTTETFYCFENTAMAIEAVLCGAPAVFMPNPYLDKPIALDELGWDGYAWGNEPKEIERARASVGQGQMNYERLVEKFFTQLEDFIERTQEKALGIAQSKKREHEAQTLVKVPADVSPAAAAASVTYSGVALFNSREIAGQIRSRPKWRFHEWFRIVRALNVVALRSILKAFSFKR